MPLFGLGSSEKPDQDPDENESLANLDHQPLANLDCPPLSNLDHAAAGGFLQLFGALDHAMGEGEDRFRVRRLIAFEHDGMAAIAALADLGVELDRAEKRHAELLGGALAAASLRTG